MSGIRPFRFLSLPLEIRLEIYSLSFAHVLSSQQHYQFATRTQTAFHLKLESGGWNALQIQQPGLVRACRQTREEGLPVFLRDRRFLIGSVPAGAVFGCVVDWMGRMAGGLAECLRFLEFDLTSLDWKSGAFEKMGSLEAFKRVEVTLRSCVKEIGMLEDVWGVLRKAMNVDETRCVRLKYKQMLFYLKDQPWEDLPLDTIHWAADMGSFDVTFTLSGHQE